MTQYEHIKNMSVDEMAIFLSFDSKCGCGCCIYSGVADCYDDGTKCIPGIKQWLESEGE